MEKPEMEQIMKKAEVLIEALPYIQKFNRKIIVVKYGGSAMSNEELQKNVIKDVTLLKLVGFKPIIVHGGGKEISALLERLQVETHFENGYRVTDQTVLETAEMALSARVNKSIVAALDRIGAKACGISGRDGGLITARQKDKALGLVGTITKVDPRVLRTLLEGGFLPVVSP
ncbi:MAG: acetylglutamate kinase, partial [Lachnospiraceae bacterium]|nr:acetylglutamate kinase [Lachnospiraceae bacterium]